ncbi:hypothetical protein [Shewanella maritima]|uniref:hypothetical protein n=1 Tax=Shewanella maritima TaxID=2520507 RepID=UPI003736675F
MLTDSNSYFSVPHQFSVYLSPWDKSLPLPSEDQLRDLQSVGLKLLTDVKGLEASCLLQLRQIDNEAKAVVDFLKLQSRKIDLVLQHIIESESHNGDKAQGLQFGGSGIQVISTQPLNVGDYYQTQIYIRGELVAVMCIAQIKQCQAIGSAPSSWQCDLDFVQILDDDVEQLVKASLNVQQKLLKQRKQKTSN